MIPLPMMVLFHRSSPCIILPIVNPGAEDGTTLIGWTNTQGAINVRYPGGAGVNSATNRDPPEGDNLFDGGTSSLSRAEQEIDLSTVLTSDQLDSLDAGNFRFKLDWWGGTFIQSNPDQPQMRVYFRAASGSSDNPIWLYSSGLKNPTTATPGGNMMWDEYHEEHRIPPGTRYIALEMYANRRSGTNNDAAFDDIRAELCVEPPKGTDPWFEFVELLAGFEGADGSTSYTEESSNGASVTFAGNAHIETTDPIEGTSSLDCDGTGDFASIADSAALVFGNYDWTIECSVVFDTAPDADGTWIFTKYQATGGARSLAIFVTNTSIELRLSQNGSTSGTNWFARSIAFTPATATRYDFAWVRKGDTSYFFVNGTLVDSAALPTTNFSVFNTTQPIRLGGSGSGSALDFLNGRIDEVRVTIGVARYTANYTPSFPFPRS